MPDGGRIFEPFFTSKRTEGGTGLGLPIARELIEGNGGMLILGDAAQGARFELAFPLLAFAG